MSTEDNDPSRTAESDAATATGLAATKPGVAVDTSSGPLTYGSRVDRYVIEEVLGAGGMGIVYRARDPELGRAVALKLVRPEQASWLSSSTAKARLLREAQAMARLSHPNTLTVLDVGTLGDQVFFAMELVDGGNLLEWLRELLHLDDDVTQRIEAEVMVAFLGAKM